ncbi:MAG TPA: uroporphyrinogen-III synthase [Actinomycetota bacterium]|nr:uroporphyrinogen-III synthase [Actinomycetota bacterium]
MPGRLEGRRVLVLRPGAQAEDLARALEAEGAEAVVAPAIRILPPSDWAPIDAALGRGHEWLVFTSVNGVGALARRIPRARPGRVAAVGPATAEALSSTGVGVDYVPDSYTTVALARGLPGPPGPVCVIRAEAAGPDLEEILSDRGFTVERVNAYRTEPAETHRIAEALRAGVDAVALTSASITQAFAGAAGHPPDPRGAAVFSIGPATTAACLRVGLDVAAEAAPHTIPGLVEAIARYFAMAAGSSPAARMGR